MGIEERIKEIVVRQLGVDEEQIIRQARFIEDLGADPQDHAELIQKFEDEFGIQIPDYEADKLSSVGDAIAYVEAHAE